MASNRIPRLRRSRRFGVIKKEPSRTRGPEPMALRPRGPRLKETDPTTLLYYMQKVSRERAVRAYRLLQQGVRGTLPELLTYDWLTRRMYTFDFQSSFMGGRLELGGAVADFVIMDMAPDGLVVWRVQGEFFHLRPEREETDAAQRERLLQERYNNQPVVLVVDLWESCIYNRSPQVYESAEVGEELPPTMGV